MKIAAIVQARMLSTRLPGKVLMDLAGKPALQRMIERLRESKHLDDIIVATTINKTDDPIVELCEKLGCNYFRGSENNVMKRVLSAAKEFNIDVIVDLTGDCPLIDWNHINTLVNMHLDNDYDMTTNILKRTFPIGYDIRICNTKALEKAYKEVDNDIDLEHAFTWIYLNPKGKQNYKVQNWSAPIGQNRPDIEITLDTPEDYNLINTLFAMGQNYKLDLTCQDVINLIDTYPHIYQQVKKIERKNYFQELEEVYKNKERENKNGESKKRGRPKKK